MYAFNTRSLMKKNRNYFGCKHRGLISLCAGGFPPQVVELKPFKGKALKKDWTNVERTSSFLLHPKKKVFGNVFPGPCLISSWILHLIAEDCALPFLCHSSWAGEQNNAWWCLFEGLFCCLESIFQLVTFLIMKSKVLAAADLVQLCVPLFAASWLLFLPPSSASSRSVMTLAASAFPRGWTWLSPCHASLVWLV